MFNLSDRVRETSLTEGSGSVTIHDTYGGFQSFASGVGNGNETFYAIENNVRFEIGLGTFNDGVLSRDLIFTSTDPSGNKINLDGVSTVFCTYPATHSIFINPDGNVSGLLPRYSGIACPDGLVQTRAFIGSGNTGNVAYWSDENTIGGDDTFIWDSSDNTLHIDGNLAVSGSIKDAQFYSSSAGSLFHAYIDNSNNDIVALHITDESDPTWKLGLKPYSTAFADAPTNGYVYGDIDSIGNVVDTDNFYIMNYTNGFFVRHRGTTLLSIDRNNGININNNSSVEVPLTVNASAGQASNLQEWKSYTGSLISSLSKDGQMELSSVKFPDGTVQTSVGVGIVTSGIIGSGTTNFIPKFSDTDTITDSVIFENGGNVGIGTDNPTELLAVSGDAQINKIQIGSQAYSVGSHTQGITHVDYDDSQSYMMISDGDNTYTSCHNLSGFNYMRGPQNSVSYQVVVGNSKMWIGSANTTEKMSVYSDRTVFNEQGNNYDFRVEGDSDENLLFADASTDRIGLGTDTPLVKLHIHAKTSEGTILSQTDLTNSFAGFLVRNQDNKNVFSAQFCNSGVAATGLRNTVLIGSRESGVPVKFYQGKETTNIIGAAGAFEPNNERIIFDVDGNTTLTAASGQNVLVSGVNLGIGDEATAYNGAHRVPLSISPTGYAVTGSPNAAQQTNKIRVYDREGNGIAGFGVSTSCLNIATSGLMHQRFYTDATLRMTLEYGGKLEHYGTEAKIADGSTYELDISSSAATLGGNRLQLKNTETVFNEAGANYDFRVEGDTEENLLFVDASTDRVGIGTDSPTQRLDVNSSGIRIRHSQTPASGSAAGNKGEVVWDSDYVYVCVATNTWKRSTLTTW